MCARVCQIQFRGLRCGGKSDTYSHRLHQRPTEKLQYSPCSCHPESESINQWDFKPAFPHRVTGAGLNDGSMELPLNPLPKRKRVRCEEHQISTAQRSDQPPLPQKTENATAAFEDVSGASFRIWCKHAASGEFKIELVHSFQGVSEDDTVSKRMQVERSGHSLLGVVTLCWPLFRNCIVPSHSLGIHLTLYLLTAVCLDVSSNVQSLWL